MRGFVLTGRFGERRDANGWLRPPVRCQGGVGDSRGRLKGGGIRVLAASGSKRLAAFPEVPTLKELGYDVEIYLWTGLFAPKDVPAPVLKILRDAARQAVQDPEFKAGAEKMQMPIAFQDADEFKDWWDRDTEMLAAAIKRIGKVESR